MSVKKSSKGPMYGERHKSLQAVSGRIRKQKKDEATHLRRTGRQGPLTAVLEAQTRGLAQPFSDTIRTLAGKMEGAHAARLRIQMANRGLRGPEYEVENAIMRRLAGRAANIPSLLPLLNTLTVFRTLTHGDLVDPTTGMVYKRFVDLLKDLSVNPFLRRVSESEAPTPTAESLRLELGAESLWTLLTFVTSTRQIISRMVLAGAGAGAGAIGAGAGAGASAGAGAIGAVTDSMSVPTFVMQLEWGMKYAETTLHVAVQKMSCLPLRHVVYTQSPRSSPTLVHEFVNRGPAVNRQQLVTLNATWSEYTISATMSFDRVFVDTTAQIQKAVQHIWATGGQALQQAPSDNGKKLHLALQLLKFGHGAGRGSPLQTRLLQEYLALTRKTLMPVPEGLGGVRVRVHDWDLCDIGGPAFQEALQFTVSAIGANATLEAACSTSSSVRPWHECLQVPNVAQGVLPSFAPPGLPAVTTIRFEDRLSPEDKAVVTAWYTSTQAAMSASPGDRQAVLSHLYLQDRQVLWEEVLTRGGVVCRPREHADESSMA